jgi:hypothetical protein
MAKKRRLKRHEVRELVGVKTDAERIIAYMQADVDDIHEREMLSPKMQEKLNRIITAKSLLLQHKFPHKVISMLEKEYGYSLASANRDFKLMNQVFGPLLTMTRDMRKVVAEEMIRQDREMALQRKDLKGMSMSTSNYIRLHGLDKDEAELPDLSKFEFHQNIIAVMPEQVGVNPLPEEQLLEKVAEWIGNDTQDIAHEDVSTT